jgi:predicted amidohydrolase
MVDADAEIFVVPAAWPAARTEHWRLFARARAVESLAYVVAVNGAGSPHGVQLAGHSAVIDPWGSTEAEAGVDPCVLRTTVHPQRVTDCRAEFPALADRRLRPALTTT